MKLFFTLHSQNGEIQVEKTGPETYTVTLENETYTVHGAWLNEHRLNVLVNAESYDIGIESLNNGTYALHFYDGTIEVKLKEAHEQVPEEELETEIDSVVDIRAPMAGRVQSVTVRENDIVKADQPLCIIEAMKMQNEIRSPSKAIVEKVHIKEGDTVRPGQTILILRSLADEK